MKQEVVEASQKKKSHQFKALMLKNLKIQSRQPCTNICQIFTPIICLVFTMLIRNIVMDKIPNNDDNIYSKMPLIPQKLNNYTLIDTFLKENISRACQQWYSFQVYDEDSRQFVGHRNGKHISKGLLGYIQENYAGKCMFNLSRQSGPLQQYSPPIMIQPTQSVNSDIYEITQYLNSVDHVQFKKYKDIHKMPDGAITFNKANNQSLSVTLMINDLRALQYHRGDGITKISYFIEGSNKSNALFTIPEGYLSLQHLISSAYINSTVNKTVETGILYMPITDPTPKTVDILINSISAVLFPISLSLLLPVYLYLLVLQKQQKLIQMMRMNGMKIRNYWIVNFLFDFIIGLLTNAIFCLFGVIFLGGGLFQNTGWDVLIVVLVGWILAQTSLATFFQVFIKSSVAANIIGYLMSIWTNLIGASLSLAIYQYPRTQPSFITCYPTFAFDRLFYLMLTKCADDRCYTSLSSLDTQAINCIIVLYVSFVVFQLLGMYLFEVVPQQYGVQQRITFPFDFLINKIRSVRNEQLQLDNQVSISEGVDVKQVQTTMNNCDSFVKQEQNRVKASRNLSAHALIVNRLRKVYSNGKQAVKCMNLIIQDKEVFGLLGPNGAGKTTLLSMITGIFGPTSGDCFVSGFSIKDNIEQVHVNIGVCPQFDILWPQLTVEQHLYFYARLRGISSKQQEKEVQKVLKEVNLQKFKKFASTQLSGGMKRRLSVGISMVGKPKIVFLDEPTTGLDPQNRRNLWEVLNNCKKQRALFLTTHSMDEADTLCNRVGIITHGVLRTIGTQQQLKKTYGSGHYLSLNIQINLGQSLLRKTLIASNQYQNQGEISFMSEEALQKNESVLSQPMRQINHSSQFVIERRRQLDQKIVKIKHNIKSMFPNSWIDRQINGFLRFGLQDIIVSQALSLLNNSQVAQIRQNWGLTTSSLQDVFIAVIRRYDELQAKQSLLTDQNIVWSNNQLHDTKNRLSIQQVEEQPQ